MRRFLRKTLNSIATLGPLRRLLGDGQPGQPHTTGLATTDDVTQEQPESTVIVRAVAPEDYITLSEQRASEIDSSVELQADNPKPAISSEQAARMLLDAPSD